MRSLWQDADQATFSMREGRKQTAVLVAALGAVAAFAREPLRVLAGADAIHPTLQLAASLVHVSLALQVAGKLYARAGAARISFLDGVLVGLTGIVLLSAGASPTEVGPQTFLAASVLMLGPPLLMIVATAIARRRRSYTLVRWVLNAVRRRSRRDRQRIGKLLSWPGTATRGLAEIMVVVATVMAVAISLTIFLVILILYSIQAWGEEIRLDSLYVLGSSIAAAIILALLIREPEFESSAPQDLKIVARELQARRLSLSEARSLHAQVLAGGNLPRRFSRRRGRRGQ